MLFAASAAGRTATWPRVSPAADPPGAPIDPNGNVLSKVEGADTWGYEWNARNELTRVTKNGVEQARFAYDPKGRRVEKVAGSLTTNYTYETFDIVREARGPTTLSYVHGFGVDEPLAIDDGGALTFAHNDVLGSIVKTTNATGAVTSTRQYDAWGNLEVGANESGHAFTGREWDPDTGLYYYRARYYDPKAARFFGEDPIGFGGGINFYAYTQDAPVNLKDPFGLESGGAYRSLWCMETGQCGPPPLPYPPSCGKPDTCSYYEKLCQSGDSYGCAAAPCCRSFGSDRNANCVRQCLIDRDAIDCSRSPSGRIKCRIEAHFVCYSVCNFSPRPLMPGSCYKVLIG